MSGLELLGLFAILGVIYAAIASWLEDRKDRKCTQDLLKELDTEEDVDIKTVYMNLKSKHGEETADRIMTALYAAVTENDAKPKLIEDMRNQKG